MTKYSILLPLVLIAFTSKGQHQVIDAETRSPVSYAHIKLADRARGVIADYHGYFSLDSSFTPNDTMVISCIGYVERSVWVGDMLQGKVVELEPDAQLLSEVVVQAEKIKYRVRKLGITKRPRKLWSADYAGTAKNGEEKAVWIPNDYSLSGRLKAIRIYVSDLGYPDAHFRVHVYDCSPFETKPGKELTRSNIIASGGDGNNWVEIDMSPEQIQVGENGCFIGIEWFDYEAKYHEDTVFNKGYTWSNGKAKDTVYSRVRSGSGVVIGAIYQKYRDSKNKLWYKKEGHWQNKGRFAEASLYTTDTLPDGRTYTRTPDNHYQGVLCINIDVAFPKERMELEFDAPKKRKLNKLERVRRDLFKYPQNNISELFSSLVKAFENDDIIYVLKYLCVYEEDQLDEILAEIDKEDEKFISDEERSEVIERLTKIQSHLAAASLDKMDYKHFRLRVGGEAFNLMVDDGLWKIHPYSHRVLE